MVRTQDQRRSNHVADPVSLGRPRGLQYYRGRAAVKLEMSLVNHPTSSAGKPVLVIEPSDLRSCEGLVRSIQQAGIVSHWFDGIVRQPAGALVQRELDNLRQLEQLILVCEDAYFALSASALRMHPDVRQVASLTWTTHMAGPTKQMPAWLGEVEQQVRSLMDLPADWESGRAKRSRKMLWREQSI